MTKPLLAVAIEYGDNLIPKPVAKGRYELARQIIDAAKAAGVPIKQDEELADLLVLLDIDQDIPDALYALIAEVLIYVNWLKVCAK